MTRTVRPAEVDEALYEQFKQFVRDHHGQVRGSLRDELETAMRERMNAANGPDRLERIEADLATLKAAVVEVEADGGTDTLDDDLHTHTPTDTEDEDVDDPPHPKASRAEKAAWLAGQFPHADGDTQIARAALAGKVEAHYSFGDRATEALVEATADRLALEPHPTDDTYLVGESRLDDLLAEQEQAAHDTATAEFDRLDHA